MNVKPVLGEEEEVEETVMEEEVKVKEEAQVKAMDTKKGPEKTLKSEIF